MSGYPYPTFRYFLGDFNNDFVVDQGDLDLILSKYGTVYGQRDLDEVLAYYGRVYEDPPQPEPQPEPEPEPEPEPQPEPEPEAEPEIIPGFVIDGLVSQSNIKFFDLKTKELYDTNLSNNQGIYLFPDGLEDNTFYYVTATGGENISTKTNLENKRYSNITFLDLLDISSNNYNINVFTTLVAELVNDIVTPQNSEEEIRNIIEEAKDDVHNMFGLDRSEEFSFNYFDPELFNKDLATLSTKINCMTNILSHVVPYENVLQSITNILFAEFYGNTFQFNDKYDSITTLVDEKNIDFIMFNVIGYGASERFGTKLYLQRVYEIIDEIVDNDTYLTSRFESINSFTLLYDVNDLSNNFDITYSSDISNNFDELTYQLAREAVEVYGVTEPQPEPEPEPQPEPEPEPEYQHHPPDSFLFLTGVESDRTLREVRGGVSGTEPLYSRVSAELSNNILMVSSNGIPNYIPRVGDSVIEGIWDNTVATTDTNRNIIGEQNYVFNIPIVDVEDNPVTSENDDINNLRVTSLHTPIGVAVNGVPFFNPFINSLGNYQSNFRDLHYYSTFDSYGGYVTGPSTGVTGTGPYYYARYPSGIEYMVIDPSNQPLETQDAGDVLNNQITKEGIHSHSPILGYMLDGYPIYGPIGTTSLLFDKQLTKCRVMRSSYRYYIQRNLVSKVIEDQGFEYVPGLGDLDKCNAIYSATPEYPRGCYHYVLSIDASGDNVGTGIRTDTNGNQLYQYRNDTSDFSKNIIQSTYPHSTIYFRGIPGTFTNLLGLLEFPHSLTYNNFEVSFFYEPTYYVQDYDISNIDLAIKRWDDMLISVPDKLVQGVSTSNKIKINVEYKLLEEDGVLGYNSTQKILDLQNQDASSNSIIIDCTDISQLYSIIYDSLGTKIPIENKLVMNTKYTEQLASWARSDGNNSYYYTVLHELGHSLGIGSLWFLNGTKSTYVDADDGVTKHVYTAENAVREYRFYTFDTDTKLLTGIPIEDDGGHGTASVHPEEGDEGHISLNNRNINGVFHPGLGNELMTGFIEWGTDPLPLSRITAAFVHDVGFEVDYNKCDHYEIDGYPHNFPH